MFRKSVAGHSFACLWWCEPVLVRYAYVWGVTITTSHGSTDEARTVLVAVVYVVDVLYGLGLERGRRDGRAG